MPLLLILACAGEADDSAGDPCTLTPPLTERIDVPAGHRVVDADVPGPWLDAPRTVPVHVWYPTDATDGDPAMYMGAVEDPAAFDDAPLAAPPAQCRMPLLVYSHGSQAWAGNNSPVLRHLVAQGWVVAAPDHVGNTLDDNWDPRPVSYSFTRIADLRATLDLLAALPAGDPLADRVDTSRVLVMGHSFGGQTAWLLAGPTVDAAAVEASCDASALGCSAEERALFADWPGDTRVVGVLPMDGFADTDLVAPAGWGDAQVPIVYLNRSGEGDDHPFETAAAADVTWARFEGACHETFTSTALPCEGFDKEEGEDLVAAWLTAFAARQVLGLQGAPYDGILDGSTSLDPRITVQTTR